MELKYYKELDGLRGIAALMVMFFHFMPDDNSAAHPLIHLLHKIGVFGQTGVILFFVLSGFLITRILFRAKQHQHYFRNFYIKRALRIFPLYYLFLALFYFIVPLFVYQQPAASQGVWMYWVYLQNIAGTFNWVTFGPAHFWSLAVEEHFYLFWPVIIYRVSATKIVRVVCIIIALALLCRGVLIYYGYGTFYFTFSVMDSMAIGAFLSWLEAEKKLTVINFNTVMVISLLLLLPAWLFTGGKGYDWVQIIKSPIISVFYMGVIGAIISKTSWLNSVFTSKVLRFTGKISYGLYVFHPLCFMFFYHFFNGYNIWINSAGCFILSYIVAAMSFYGFELHFMKLKKYFEMDQWRKKQEMQFE